MALLAHAAFTVPAQPHPERLYYIVFLLMFGAGVYLFFKGFKVYWESRVLKNLPVSAIRGLAMGLVRVRGRATGAESLISPLTRQPCFYYILHVAKWETDSRNKPYWRRWSRDSNMVRFYLEDETGKVLLNPRGAEFELETKFQQIIEGELPDNLFTFSHQKELPPSEIEPDAAAGSDDSRERAQLELIGAIAKGGARSEPGRFRLTEYTIVPDNMYEATGTCTPNPLSNDVADRNQIKKGKNESIFVITDHGALEKVLDLRAVASIWGGALLAVLSAALILVLYRTS